MLLLQLDREIGRIESKSKKQPVKFSVHAVSSIWRLKSSPKSFIYIYIYMIDRSSFLDIHLQ